MKNPFTPRGYLQLSSLTLLALGLFSFIFPRGVVPGLGAAWWFDLSEGVVHLGIAAILFAGAKFLSDKSARTLVLITGIVGTITALYGFTLPNGPLGTFNALGIGNLEPADNVFHLFGGVWALYVAYASRGARSSG